MTQTKEAYKLEINGQELLFTKTPRGKMKAGSLVYFLYPGEDRKYTLTKVRVPATKKLLDE